MRSLMFFSAITSSLLTFSTQTQAQTSDECMSEVRKVQAFIDNSSDPDDSQNDIATDHLETAEFDANKGDGAKCMQSVDAAKGASGYHE
jgi:hypothetical protein